MAGWFKRGTTAIARLPKPMHEISKADYDPVLNLNQKSP